MAVTQYRSTLASPRAALLAPMLAAALAFLPAAGAVAQNTAYQPEVGQAGKDVVWVPTSQALVEKMLDIAKVTPKDYLIDLGSGDGRTVITAAQRGLTAHGIEFNPDMVALARQAATKAGVADRATFTAGDLFEADLSRAQVITMFLLPSINEKLRPTLLDMKPGTRVVSNTFRMGDWQPDETATVTDQCQNWCTALLWIVPAKVEGAWKLGNRDLKLSQQYQMLTGTLGQSPISDARLKGNEISFTADGVRYTGTVDGKRMTGKADKQGNWTASRS
ncbi:SAM-dependent methyltransferase [Bordetella genomosp. 13]|uniref:SAM-dependent methyltransferase n=1 Tax=Bordetella genomosp. 13 TaxID=463040 RepID=A0A1W6ZF38_9BORD|nr:class I SAM-dependent methyltransferase [Bordetella genomosp. 13]ARP95760.1 SAM-dependent methyltransferase [Bordetella genomosp. 13]